MPRPCKVRLIKNPPLFLRFKPVGVPARDLETEFLSIDEYEAIRLADYEGLSHEDSANLMEVSRPTFSRLIEKARLKASKLFIEGKELIVDGGTYKFQNFSYKCNSCGHVTITKEKIDSCPECGSKDLVDVLANIENREDFPKSKRKGRRG